MQMVAADMEKLRQKLADYDAGLIFNVDETGTFFKLFPRRTYICSFENKKPLPGTKAMRAKDIIAAYVCTNTTGTKVPMYIIGTAKNPRCFRLGASAVHYLSQKRLGRMANLFAAATMNCFGISSARYPAAP